MKKRALVILLCLCLCLTLCFFVACGDDEDTTPCTEHTDANNDGICDRCGAKIEMPATPLKTGSLFGGWFKDEECTQPWDFDEDTVDKNMTLYARWN